MTKTYWRCNVCGARGVVRHAERADVYTVLNRIKNDHMVSAMPPCEFDAMKVQVSRKPFTARTPVPG